MAMDMYRFWHVIEGELSGHFGVEPMHLVAGTGIILPPQRGYLESAHPIGSSISVLMANFQIITAPLEPNPLLLLPLPVPVAARDRHAAAILCRRIGESGCGWASDWMTRIALRPLLEQMLIQHLIDGNAQGAWQGDHRVPDWLRDLSNRCGREILDPRLNAGNLHRLAGRSREHVARSLRRHYGVGAAAFIRGQRIRLAARLLAQGGMNVSEVAERVGYRDRSLFSRHFKAIMGAPPTAWQAGSVGSDHR